MLHLSNFSFSTLALVTVISASVVSPAFSWWGDSPYHQPKINRQLMDAGGSVMSKEAWQTYNEKCSEFEFELGLLVDTHLVLIAMPHTEEAMAAGCAPLLFHAKMTANEGPHQKEVVVLESTEEEVATILEEESIKFRTHQFFNIATAYDLAGENAPGAEGRDVILNNCGDFVSQFGAFLGLKWTPEVTMEISQRLLKNGGDEFVKSIRGNEHFSALGVDEDVDDMELVRSLVDSRRSI